MKRLILILFPLTVFAQQKPVLIPMETDTIVGITQNDFDVVIFGFTYINHLEKLNNIASNELTRCDSINSYLMQQLTLEQRKSAEKDTIIDILNDGIKQRERSARKEKVKSTLLSIGLGLGMAIEAGVITYLLLR